MSGMEGPFVASPLPGDYRSTRTKTNLGPVDELPDIPVASWMRLFRVLDVCAGREPVPGRLSHCPGVATRCPSTTWVEDVFAGRSGDAPTAMVPALRHSDLGADTGGGQEDAIGAVFFVGLPKGLGDLPPGSVVSVVERGTRTICSVFPRRDEGWERGAVFYVPEGDEGVGG